jgi:glycosyltransferase involved in cell wall biosynthesis
MSERPEVLIIGKVWPEPDSSAAGTRMLQLIELLQEGGWSVHFGTAAGPSEFAEDLSKWNVDVHHLKMNHDSFDQFIKKLSPQMVLFDRFMTEEQFGWRVAEQCPDAIRILDSEDLHGLRTARHKALKEGREFQFSDLNNEVAYREIASIFRCDCTLIISEFESELLKSYFKIPEEILHYIPLFMGDNDMRSSVEYNERQHFISIGNFLHEPNWQAVRYLKTEIWPKIRTALPQAELHIYGAYPSEKVFQLNNESSGFLVKGRAEEVESVMTNAKVLLAPLLFGAGIKGKLLDAMKFGTPSVTTWIGAEGMCDSKEDWPGALCDHPDDFVEESIRLYQNKADWEQAHSLCKPLLKKRFDKQDYTKPFLDKVDLLIRDREAHRSTQFYSHMMRHHSLNSVKYLSKWIEAKNQ